MDASHTQIHTLATLRDLTMTELPELLNGELSVASSSATMGESV